MKYIKVEWPKIQEYMDNPDYSEECYFDPRKNAWFIPEDWDEQVHDAIDEALRDLALKVHKLICETHDFSVIDKYVTDICDF